MRPRLDRFDYRYDQGDGDAVDHEQLGFMDPDFGKLGRIRFEGGEYFLDDLSVFVKPPL